MYFYLCGDTSEKQCSREGGGGGVSVAAAVWGGVDGCSESTNTFLYSLWCIAQLPACCSFGQSSLMPPRPVHTDEWNTADSRLALSVGRNSVTVYFGISPRVGIQKQSVNNFVDRMRQVLCLSLTPAYPSQWLSPSDGDLIHCMWTRLTLRWNRWR